MEHFSTYNSENIPREKLLLNNIVGLSLYFLLSLLVIRMSIQPWPFIACPLVPEITLTRISLVGYSYPARSRNNSRTHCARVKFQMTGLVLVSHSPFLSISLTHTCAQTLTHTHTGLHGYFKLTIIIVPDLYFSVGTTSLLSRIANEFLSLPTTPHSVHKHIQIPQHLNVLSLNLKLPSKSQLSL